MRNLQITQAITNRENKSVEFYFTEISKEELITAQEEVVLAQKIRNGDTAALEKLVKSNLRFVVSVAKKYQYQGLPLSDLINEGNLGLIKAAHRFDETRGFKFISFAVWWIRQSIVFAIAENARMIRLPLNKVGDITKVNKAISRIEQETLREPTIEQIAGYLGVKADKVRDALYYAPWTSSIDATFCEEDEYSLLDKLPLETDAADHVLVAESVQYEIDRLLCGLTSREREIIEMTYGMKGGFAMSPIDISKNIGMCAERIRQIRNAALDKLRNNATVSAR
ncbi:sigma-70 family RNA polymerase sigma factor [Mucilaginibacter gotjawali]|nr:RNA polymerase sigma factor RpoD/SigA [Mucilaginibacter gotjawali]